MGVSIIDFNDAGIQAIACEFNLCRTRKTLMVTPARFERTTYGLGIRCSILLSYGARTVGCRTEVSIVTQPDYSPDGISGLRVSAW